MGLISNNRWWLTTKSDAAYQVYNSIRALIAARTTSMSFNCDNLSKLIKLYRDLEIDDITITYAIVKYCQESNGFDTIDNLKLVIIPDVVREINKRKRRAEKLIMDRRMDELYWEYLFDNKPNLNTIRRLLPYDPNRLVRAIDNLRASGLNIYLTNYGPKSVEVWTEYKRLMFKNEDNRRIYMQLMQSRLL